MAETSQETCQELEHVVEANDNFAKRFYSILSKQEPDKNIVFSPLSAHTVLTMAYQGASKKTALDFEKVLALKDKKTALTGYKAIVDHLNTIQKIILHVANKVFVKQNFPLKSEFEKRLSQEFRSETQHLNFDDATQAAKIINDWIEEKTDSKITDLIDPTMLDKHTRLVLVNAVYFKGNWDRPFDKNLTETKPFYLTKQTTTNCQMMYCKSRFKYCENEVLNAKILQLPYNNRNVSLLVILPNEIDGLVDLESRLENYDLADALNDRLSSAEIKVYLPRFKIEAKLDLKDLLVQMGLDVIFDKDNADFSEISDSDECLYVSKVIQKTFIEINEEGSEAAVATGMVFPVGCCLMMAPEVQFVANHPFIIYLIEKIETSSRTLILFSGKVTNP